jgi:two-component system, OmpR family, sensor histidine kinase KdpD
MAGPSGSRGRLKVYLGYAAGVGKTYQMLLDARQMRAEGVDLVIGYVEPHDRPETMALTDGLESVPLRATTYRGIRLEEMDLDGVRARHPAVAVVDEFPHTNVPGSCHAKRWIDVQQLLDDGIDVLTTLNVQHLESLNDQIWQSTGVRVRETIPDWVVRQADDIVMVDLAPAALLNRLARGAVYPRERASAALEHFFKLPTLVALRELAMRQAAHVVESRMASDEAAVDASTGAPPVTERVLVLVGPELETASVIRRARRVADYLRADCLAVYVSRTAAMSHLRADERERLERHLNFARALQIETRVLQGHDVAGSLVDFARQRGVTQIFLARDARHRRWSWWRPPVMASVVACATGLQVTIVADRSTRSGAQAP